LLSSLLLSPVSGSYYAQVCRADRIVELVLNETSNLYEYQQVNTTSASDDENENETRTQFRECNCPRPISHPHSVCPIDTSICGIPNDTKEPILCFQDDTAVILVRNVWPLVCLWYMCFVIFLCCSYKGRHAITYCVQRCFPNMNTYIVNRILHQRVLQEQRIWTFWADNRPTTNSSESDDTPTELVLKTKLFHAVAIESRSEGLPSLLSPMPTSNEGENDDDPAFCCTICFAPLEEGDRIGDLPCDHGYHVECLKGWVQRKNTCPLCAIPLATPRSKPSHEQQQERRGSENV